MIKLKPWYSEDGDAYHFISRCPIGASIASTDFKYGMGGKEACFLCMAMDAYRDYKYSQKAYSKGVN